MSYAQKTANLLCVLECVKLVTASTLPATERKTNQTVLMQHKVLDYLLDLALHSSSAKISAEVRLHHRVAMFRKSQVARRLHLRCKTP